MGTQPLIRDATADDLPALRDVFRRASLSNAGELEALFVDPDFMRRGIATALIRDLGGPLDVTANEHALAFYERVGFITVGTTETPGGPAPRMELRD